MKCTAVSLKHVRVLGMTGMMLVLLMPASLRADDPKLKTEIDRIIQPLFDQNKAVGIVVGIIQDDRRHVFSYGRVSKDSSRAPDGDSVFEIGSITKTFTSLLLAEMVKEGLVKLENPVRLYMPAGVKVPSRNGKEITLRDLATHRSGLPRISNDWQFTFDTLVAANPYKSYHARQLYAFLSRYELPRDIGAEWEYSNLGMGLLGHVLARVAETSYENLIIRRITSPLGMNSTRITLPDDLRARLATGHIATSHPTPNWDFDVLAGCGAIRSSANDMLRYLAANMDIGNNPLQAAMDMCQQPRCTTDNPNTDQGLGWLIRNNPDDHLKIIWHNGGTFGYLSYSAFVREARTGVVVLSNCFAADPDNAGLAILKMIAKPKE